MINYKEVTAITIGDIEGIGIEILINFLKKMKSILVITQIMLIIIYGAESKL